MHDIDVHIRNLLYTNQNKRDYNSNAYVDNISSIGNIIRVLLFPYFSGNVSAQSNMSMNMSSSMNMSTTTNYTNAQFLTYKNPILGVEIKHPSEWKAIEKHISKLVL